MKKKCLEVELTADLIFPIYKFIKDKKKFQAKLLITGSNLYKKYSNEKKNFQRV